MRKSTVIAAERAQKGEAWKALFELPSPTEEQEAQFNALTIELKKLDTEMKNAVAAEEYAAENEATLKSLNQPISSPALPDATASNDISASLKTRAATPAFVIPAGRVTSLKNFKGQDAELQAYKFGQWFLAQVVAPAKPEFGSRFAKNVEWVKEHTNYFKAQNETTNLDGGALVPEEFDRNIIDLRERFGVFRRYSKVVPMMSDTKLVPRRVNGLTPYFVTDNEAITESQKGWDNVTLTAQKLAVLAKYSSEVAEDAIINMGDDLAGEIAYAFSLKEDQCGFIGDASLTYGKMTGVTQALLGLSATRANIAGLHVGTGNLFSELTLTDFEAVVAKLPEYADTPNARWFCHKSFYHNVMERLQLAAGGVTSVEIVNGARVFRFLGYEVVFTQVMPSTDANDQVACVLGDLALGSRFGDRRQNTIALDTSLGFANDQWAIRGTERFDIVVHDVGNASGTASLRVPGPIVGLLMAAS